MAKTNASQFGHTKLSLNIGKPEMATRGNYLDKVQRAYMAGIIDGEGSLSIHKQPSNTCRAGYRFRVSVCMTNTDYKLVMRMKNWFGGTVYLQKQRHENRKPIWRWNLNSVHQCLYFLKQIEPYLFVKKKQARLCLDFLENGGMGYNGIRVSDEEFARRTILFEKCRLLNHRGAEPQRLSERAEDSPSEAIVQPLAN